jgi:hypothetical protein
MQAKFLGDSFDIVKRLWADRLRCVAATRSPAVAAVGRVAAAGRLRLRTLLRPAHRDPVSDDKDRGKASASQRLSATCVGSSHAFGHSTSSVSTNATNGPVDSEERPSGTRGVMHSGHGLESFYYASHATFLFAGGAQALDQVMCALVDAGLPPCRFERMTGAPSCRRGAPPNTSASGGSARQWPAPPGAGRLFDRGPPPPTPFRPPPVSRF